MKPTPSRSIPCALSIAGLDPGGGAGILADMRGFAAAGVFGSAVVAVLTVQSTSGLRASKAVPSSTVIAQATCVMKNQRVRAMKLGALGSPANVRALGDFLAIHRGIPVVCDPVMVPTRGPARLLHERATEALRTQIVPRSSIVTANAPEAEVLTGMRVTRLSEAHDAARAIVAMGATAALVKGGHLAAPHAVDVLAVGGRVIELRAVRLAIPSLHGGGCVLSALIAGRLAADPRDFADDRDAMLLDAARWARKLHRRALETLLDVGGDMKVLGFGL